MELAELKEERQILQNLIKANIGLSKDRANALEEIFRNPAANMTTEEMQQKNRKRLQGMAEMAFVRLRAANLSPLNSSIDKKYHAPSFGNDPYHALECEDANKIPEIRIQPPEEDELPAVTSHPLNLAITPPAGSEEEPADTTPETYSVYYDCPEEGEYSTTFPKRWECERQARKRVDLSKKRSFQGGLSYARLKE